MDQSIEIIKGIEEMKTDLKWLKDSIGSLASDLRSLRTTVSTHHDELTKIKERSQFNGSVLNWVSRNWLPLCIGIFVVIKAHLIK